MKFRNISHEELCEAFLQQIRVYDINCNPYKINKLEAIDEGIAGLVHMNEISCEENEIDFDLKDIYILDYLL